MDEWLMSSLRRIGNTVTDDPPSTVRYSPVAIEVADLWSAHRSTDPHPSPCGNEGHRLALNVAPEPHRYGFQCVGCSWRTGWFRR